MIQDFEFERVLDKAAKKYRVIVFDRPGYGHSRRPRGRPLDSKSWIILPLPCSRTRGSRLPRST